MLSAVLQLVLTSWAAAIAAPDAAASTRLRSYCGYSFAIRLADDETIQFAAQDKMVNYHAELRDGELKLLEHGPALPSAVKQRRILVQGSVETFQLTKAGQFAGYRIRDIGQRTNTFIAGPALSGSLRDRDLLRRFDFGAGRRGSCAVIRTVTPK